MTKRKISLVSIILITLISVFLFPSRAQAGSYSINQSAVRVTVSDPTLVNKSGTKITDNNIKLNSDWIAPSPGVMIANQYYFQIANNEYILADDTYPYIATNKTIKITSNGPAQLYTYDGKEIQNRMLAPNTLWHSDRIIGAYGFHKSNCYLRVATNEYVRSVDATTLN
ncbi:SLAP domain-containing protein [Lactobacillus terrae]|uniref:SLAP domain-containing protein n=1 Tax=Lactobacillus terrae TaxID=2269374 RepID=UPI000C1B7BF8|nr:SLAP domain-containing protein [Lactobacillus terrae]